MLKKIILIIGALVLCALLFLFAHSNFGFNPNYTIGVIKSSTEEFDSAISYYDENLNLLYSRKLFLCSLTNNSRCFVDLGKKKYMLSDGTYWIGCPDAIELDSQTGKIKKYYADANCSLAMTANDRYIFTTYSAKDAYIHRCDKKTGELKKMTISGSCDGMYLDNNNVLYAFGGDSDRVISNLYIIDAEKMKILKTFDVKDKGFYQRQCIKIGDDLYFLNSIKFYKGNKGEGEKCHTLTKFNTKTYEFEDIDIDMIPRKMVRFEDNLYISSNDDLSNDILAVYNTKTGEVEKKTVEEKSAYCHMAVDEKNKKLYTTSGTYLRQYDLPSLRLLKKIDCLGKERKKYTAFVVFTK